MTSPGAVTSGWRTDSIVPRRCAEMSETTAEIAALLAPGGASTSSAIVGSKMCGPASASARPTACIAAACIAAGVVSPEKAQPSGTSSTDTP